MLSLSPSLAAAVFALTPPAVVPAPPPTTPAASPAPTAVAPAPAPAAAVAPAPAPTPTPAAPPVSAPVAADQTWGPDDQPSVPAEAIAPPMDPAPVTAPTLDPLEYEVPVPTVRAPFPVDENGRGMIIAGSIVGGLGLVVKIGMSRAIGDGLASRGDDAFGVLNVAASTGFASILYNPLIGAGLGLLGGGFARRGRWAADQDLFRGATGYRRARRPGLGWGLFAGGVLLWAATRVAGTLACETEQCTFAVLEGGYYGSLAMTGVGLPLGAWSTGYNRYESQFPKAARSLSVAPMASRRTAGLSISGRF